MSNKKTFYITLYGKVQGVGFRYFAREKALEYSLTGWVKNLPDRTVEIEVKGETSNIEVFIDFLKIGNGYSRVDKFHKTEITNPRSYHSFQIKY